MGTSSGLWTKFYFLACGDDYKLVSLVYFLHKCQSRGLESHPSSQIFLWLTWHGIKSKFLLWSTRPLRHGPFYLRAHQPHKIHEAGSSWRATLLPVSSALKALPPVVITTHSLTLLRYLCKSLPFRDARPSLLSSYPLSFFFHLPQSDTCYINSSYDLIHWNISAKGRDYLFTVVSPSLSQHYYILGAQFFYR